MALALTCAGSLPLLAPDTAGSAARRARPRPTARRTASRRAPPSRCAAIWSRCSARSACSARAIDLIALRLRREPVPALPGRGGDGARRRRRRQGARLRARDGHGGELPRRRHEPQRPGADGRHHDRRAPLVLRRARSKTAARACASGRARCWALANRLLARHGYKLGPDPASKDIATIGGVIANNSGGMRCGVTWDPYSTVESMTLVLASGTVIDTAAPDAEARFAAAEPELAQRPARAARRAARGRAAGRSACGASTRSRT